MGLAAIPAVLAVASAGAQMAGQRGEGIQKKTAAQIDSVKLKMAAEAGKVRALQTDAAYRDELNATMQNIGAIRASQNVGFDSPTSFAIYDKAEKLSDNARTVAVSNERLKAIGLEGDAAAAWKRGETANTAAALSMAGTGLSALSKVSGSLFGKGGSSS